MKRTLSHRSQAGFTIMEVVIATSVVAMLFASVVMSLGISFRFLDNARLSTLASQVLQSEVETMRLLSWDQIIQLDEEADLAIEQGLADAAFERFSGTRRIIHDHDHRITLEVEVRWEGINGREHERRYIT
ncbi:MAG: type II secretion system protein, partial [Puniceicoccaceae bacterium]